MKNRWFKLEKWSLFRQTNLLHCFFAENWKNLNKFRPHDVLWSLNLLVDKMWSFKPKIGSRRPKLKHFSYTWSFYSYLSNKRSPYLRLLILTFFIQGYSLIKEVKYVYWFLKKISLWCFFPEYILFIIPWKITWEVANTNLE